MKRCPECGHTRSWRLADGRLRCRRCRTRYRWTSAWDGVRLSEATKRRLLELFVFGVPSYRLRFRAGVSAPTIERFFRLVRACMALAEDLRAPFEGAVECDEAVFGGRRRDTKRGVHPSPQAQGSLRAIHPQRLQDSRFKGGRR
jgi:transposase